MPDIKTDGVPLFIPVAFSEDEATAAYAAINTIFMSSIGSGETELQRPLAQAMLRLGMAVDKAKGRGDDAE